MIGVRHVVSILVALALILSILELSSLASERHRAKAKVVRPPVADVLRSSPPVASELDGRAGPDLRPAVTF